MLEFNNVSKEFGGIKALSDVNFKISPGEFVFITGESGAGKTTLLKLLIREYLPTTGSISFDGSDISQIKKRKVHLLRQEIGAVFQDYKLLSDRTIFENVMIPLLVVKAPKEERNERVEKALSLVGLNERMHLFPSQLSGGELQRAALARALVKKPKLIFADEPTGNLDDDTAKGIFDLLSKINKEEITIIVTTHNNHFVRELKKREIKLKNGKVIKDIK